jgi:hypothetical protein
MKLQSAMLLGLFLSACGGEDSSSYRSSDVPVAHSNSHSALVRWTLDRSTCPGEEVPPPTFTTGGTVIIEEDQIEIGLTSMPVLRGTIDSGRARIGGENQFWQEEWVTCTVVGDADVQTSNLVVAQVNETLSSASALNCAQDWTLHVEY